MPKIRHLLLLSCAQVLASACASRGEVASQRPLLADASRHDIEADLRALTRSAAGSASNPYAPSRTANPTLFAWQSEKRAACQPDFSTGTLGAEPRVARGMLASFPERARESTNRTQTSDSEFVISGLRPALRRCFSHWLDDRVDAQGSVRFALELGCTGEVEAISAENEGVDQATLTCLFAAVAPARFSPPAGGRATVLVPVVFKNARR